MDLATASREDLLALIAELQARIRELEGRAGSGRLNGMPGLKPRPPSAGSAPYARSASITCSFSARHTSAGCSPSP
jgi:hypothetical protein